MAAGLVFAFVIRNQCQVPVLEVWQIPIASNSKLSGENLVSAIAAFNFHGPSGFH